jgi:hypothetical protein
MMRLDYVRIETQHDPAHEPIFAFFVDCVHGDHIVHFSGIFWAISDLHSSSLVLTAATARKL